MDDTIQSLKDSIRQEIISYKKNVKNDNKYSINKGFNENKKTSKAQISDYFNKIKHNSKINLSNTLSINDNFNYNKNELNSLNSNDSLGNINNKQHEQNYIIYETFKNILNKNNNNNNNNKFIDNNIPSTYKTETGRFNIISEEKKEKNPVFDSIYFDNMKYDNNIPDIEESNTEIITENEKQKEKKNLNLKNDNIKYQNNNNDNEIVNSFEQTSLLNDINQLKNIKIEHSNNYCTSNTNTNTNTNPYIISNGFKTTYYPQNVSSFSMINENNQNSNSHFYKSTKREKLKRNDYYRTEYYKLRRKYFNILSKYEKGKKDSELSKLKGFYEAHKNDKKFNYIKEINEKLSNQLNENTKFFDYIENIIQNKEKEIEEKNDLIIKQKILIDRLIEQINMENVNNIERNQQNNVENYEQNELNYQNYNNIK